MNCMALAMRSGVFPGLPGNVFTQGCDDLVVMCFQLSVVSGIIAVCLGIAFCSYSSSFTKIFTIDVLRFLETNAM